MSRIQVLLKRKKLHFHRNADGFDKLSPGSDGIDEDEMDYEVSSASGHIEDGDADSDVDPPEFEVGIRRAEMAKDCKIEDLTLSDIILDPDGNITYYWLGMVTLAVVYNIAVIVLRVAFKEMRDQIIQDSVFGLFDLIGDLIYVLDIFVHLRVSFYEDGCLVLDPVKIVERYTKSSKFIMDLLSILPLWTTYNIVSWMGSIVYLDISILIGEDLHIMLVRVPRLLKYRSMIKFFDLTDSRTRNPNLVRASKLSLNLWVVIHWIGCFYYMVSEYEGLGTNDWVYPNGTDFKPFSRKYIRVMYWSLMTLTTIGERPAPETDLEFVFTGLTFLIGVFVFAAVVGNVGDVISNMNAARQEFQGRMDQIKSYLQHRQVDDKLQNRVKRWADYTWTRTQAIDEPTLLQMLPDRLRTEIAINVHLETLKKVKIFEECEEGLLRELVLKLRPQVYSPGDYICRIGEIGREMFIVNHGKVEILVPNSSTGRRTVIATLNPGNYFGEISLLKLDDGQNRRTADVRAVGYSELLRLSRRDLMSALVEYPNAKSILEHQAKERMQKTKEVRRTSGTDESTPHDATPDDNQPIKKKDILLQVIKSANFQKLMASRNSDALKDMRQVLEELKTFDSQTTKEKLESLSKEKQQLKQELKDKSMELIMTKNKYDRLLSKRCSKCSRSHSTGGIPNGMTNGRGFVSHHTVLTDGIDDNFNELSTHDNNNANSNSLADRCLISQSSLPNLHRRRNDAHKYVNGDIKHSPDCLTTGSISCKCRNLEYSASHPELIKSNAMCQKANKSGTNTDQDIDKSASQIPEVKVTEAPDLTADPDLCMLEDGGNSEQAMKVIERYFTLDPSNFLTSDTTPFHSSEESSDDNSDFEFDLKTS